MILQNIAFQNYRKRISSFIPFIKSKTVNSKTLFRLSAISEKLRQVCHEVEEDFLQLGGALQLIHSDTSELRNLTFRAVGKIGDESDKGLLSEIRKFTENSLADIENFRSSAALDTDQLKDISESLSALCDICTEIENIGRFLNVVGINMGIECSGSAVAEEMFESVCREIKELASQVIDVANDIRLDSQYTRIQQIEARKNAEEGLSSLNHLSTEANEKLDNAISQIDLLVGYSSSAMGNAGEKLQKISDRIGDLVVAIQFQDNMRQRADHIADGLIQAHDLLSSEKFDHNSEQTRNSACLRASRLIYVQIAQLEDIISAISTIRSQCTDALGEIIRDIEGLEQSLSRFEPNGATMVSNDFSAAKNCCPKGDTSSKVLSAATGDNPFQMLTKALGNLRTLLSRGAAIIDRIAAAAARTSNLSNSLTGHVAQVGKISSVTHILSLNAIIMSGKLGREGETLEVLAQNVSGLSRQVNKQMGKVSQLLDSVGRLTTSMQTTAERSDQQRLNPLKDSLDHKAFDEIICGLSDAYTIILENGAESAKRSTILKTDIVKLRTDLCFLSRLSDSLSEFMEDLQKLIRDSPALAAQPESPECEAIRHLQTGYTMEKEREIFNRSMSTAGETSSLLPEEHTENISEENSFIAKDGVQNELGDNVELF